MLELSDPGFRGASAEEIARLESLVGAPLPADYRAFLETMGRDTAGLLDPDQMTTAIDDMVDLYEEDDYEIPPGALVFAIIHLGEVFFLDLREPHEVFEIARGGRRMIAASLRGYLHQRAFLRDVRQRYAYKTSFYTRTLHRRATEEWCEAQGMRTQSFSDDTTFCCASERECLAFEQFHDGVTYVSVATNRSLLRLWSMALRVRLLLRR